MNGRLLSQYIRLSVREAHLARVPNQLISTDKQDGADEEGEAVSEFSGAGGGNALGSGEIMGFSAPLGTGKARKKKQRRK